MDDQELANLFVVEMRAYLPVLREQLTTIASPADAPTRQRGARELSRSATALTELGVSVAVADCAALTRALAQIYARLASTGENTVPATLTLEQTAAVLAYIEQRVDEMAAANALTRPDPAQAHRATQLLAALLPDEPPTRNVLATSTAEEDAAADGFAAIERATEYSSDAISPGELADEDVELIRAFQHTNLRHAAQTQDVRMQVAASTRESAPAAPSLNIADAETAPLVLPPGSVAPALPAARQQGSEQFATISDEELDVIPEEMKHVFVMETAEDLQMMRRALLQLAEAEHLTEAMQTLTRTAHKIKGAAATLGFDTIAIIAYQLEDVLKAAQRGQLPAQDGGESGLDQLFHLLEGGLEAARDGNPLVATLEAAAKTLRDQLVNPQQTPASATEHTPRIAVMTPPESEPTIPDTQLHPTAPPATRPHAASTVTPPDSVIRVEVARLDALMDRVGALAVNRATITHARQEMVQLQGEIEQAMRRLVDLNDYLSDLHSRTVSTSANGSARVATGYASPAPQHTNGVQATPNSHHLWDELEFDRYTEFDHTVRVLSEAISDVATLNSTLRLLMQRLGQSVESQEVLMEQMQQDVIHMRLVPLDEIIPRLAYSARKLASDENKQATFTTRGEMTEIDRNISNALIEPLTQLVRNAIVHGIEPPDERAELGKPPMGHVWLHAYYVGNEVTIEVGDDGRGVNPNQLLATAITLGVLDLPTAQSMRHDEALGLMFVHGISTASNVGVSAGRGVGLDQVRQAILQMKGSIQVRSELGKGTVFRVRVPISLSIVRVLQVVANGQAYAIPFSSIERTMSLPTTHILVTTTVSPGEDAAPQHDAQASAVLGMRRRTRIERSRPSGTLHSGPGAEPVYDEVELFALAELLEAPFEPREPQHVILATAGQRRFGMLVDEVREESEAVVRALPRHLRRPAIRGATVTATGEILPLLDLPELIEATARRDSNHVADKPLPAPLKPETQVLVVDDSISMRNAVAHMLTRVGIEVRTARDGLEALSVMMAHPPQVVVLDIEMPKLDGFELLSVMRSTPRFDDMRVVMLTSRDAEKHRTYAQALGADAYLTKPCPPELLIETVRHFFLERIRSS